MPAHQRPLLATASLLAALGFVPIARAETTTEAALAKDLFDQGRQLAAEGNYDGACAKFEASLSQLNGAGTRFNLADCEEHRRHYLRAQTLFLEVAEQARDAGQPEREQVARERAAALEPRLSRLTVELQTPAVEFELDGRPVSNETLIAPVAVEPGRHRVSAKRPGKEPWTSEINVPRPGLFVVVKVPRLEDAQANPSPVSAVPAPPAAVPVPEPALVVSATRAERARTARSVALVLGGVGVGAVLAGATFGLQYLSSNHDAKGVCPSSKDCSSDEVSTHQTFLDDTKTKRTWAYVGLGVGTAALASAAIVYFTLGRQGSVEARTGMSSDGTFDVALQSRF